MARRRVAAGVLALLWACGCSGPRAEHERTTYYRWLETIPSRYLALTIRGVRSQDDLARFREVARDRFAATYWFREIGTEPRPGGFHLVFDCAVRLCRGSEYAAEANVAWTLTRLSEGNPGARECIAAGDVCGVASERYGPHPAWLKKQAFRSVVDAIVRALARKRPLVPVEPVVARPPTGKTVAPFNFQLCGEAFEHGLGMADSHVSDALTSSRWVDVIPRQDLAVVLQEISFETSDTAEKRSRRVGEKIKGADMLLFGTVAEHSGCHEIDVRLVDVATGAIVRACHGGCYRPEQLHSTCNRIVNRLTARPLRPVAPSKRRVAVVLITERTPEAREAELGSCFAAALTTALAQRQGVCVVERTWLEQILKEQGLLSSDLVSQKAFELGKLFVADYLVVGDVGGGSLSISVISVRDGGAKLPLTDGGTVEFLPSHSFWRPASLLADRMVEAIQGGPAGPSGEER
ncbi:MAG: CsgG/HfaB family protein [Candidatus Brocadiia bacterium]